jgi:uncharacterized protein
LISESFSKGDATVSYELKFMEMAKRAGKTIGGLEEIQDQMIIFDKIPYKDQAEMLVDAINEIKKDKTSESEIPSEFQGMVKVYKAQDIEGMVAAITNSKLSGNESMLLEDRNKNWIPKIISKAKKEPTFFAVGAGHLGGQMGVIRLLRKEGYVLTPLFENIN